MLTGTYNLSEHVTCEHVNTTNERKNKHMKNRIKKMNEIITNEKARSCYRKGVKAYAFELMEDLESRCDENGRFPKDRYELKEWLLNGANDWKQFSYGGCSLIYDEEIAERLCTSSELRRNKNGERNPNRRMTWIDLQAQALKLAFPLVLRAFLKTENI